MKKIIIAGIGIAVMLLAVSCKRAGDVIATYTGGKITRGEFYDWMDARKMTKDAIIKKNLSKKAILSGSP